MSDPQTPTVLILIKTSVAFFSSGTGLSIISIFRIPVKTSVFIFLFFKIQENSSQIMKKKADMCRNGVLFFDFLKMNEILFFNEIFD
jgi:hypothetical protein